MPSVGQRHKWSILGAKSHKVLFLAREAGRFHEEGDIGTKPWEVVGFHQVGREVERETGEKPWWAGVRRGECGVLGWVARFVWSEVSHQKIVHCSVGGIAQGPMFELTCMTFSSRVILSLWPSGVRERRTGCLSLTLHFRVQGCNHSGSCLRSDRFSIPIWIALVSHFWIQNDHAYPTVFFALFPS